MAKNTFEIDSFAEFLKDPNAPPLGMAREPSQHFQPVVPQQRQPIPPGVAGQSNQSNALPNLDYGYQPATPNSQFAPSFQNGSTNIPQPVDITGAFTDIFSKKEPSTPQIDVTSPTGLVQPDAQQEAAAQQAAQQEAIAAFAQTVGAPPPAQGMPSVPSADPTAQQAQPAPTSRIDEIASQVGGVADAMGLTGTKRDEFMRKHTQAQNIASAKKGIGERIAAKEIIKSLQSQGMSPEDIKKKIGVTPQTTPAEALAGLKRIQGAQELATGDSTNYSKARDDSLTGAKWGTDEQGNQVPENEQAQGSIYFDRADDFGPDPQSEQRLKDYMSRGQQNQLERAVKSLSRGIKISSDERRRLDNMFETVEKKREREYAKEQDILERKTLRDAAKKAKTAEEKSWLDNQKTEIGVLNDRIKEYNDATTKGKKGLMSPEQYRELLNRRGAITAGIESFNKGEIAGFEAGVQAATQQAGSHQEANQAAKDAGQSTYTFNGENFVVQ